MKKSFLIALAFLGLSLTTLQAQNCCATKTENCKPKTCCPTTPKCCSDEDVNANKKTVTATTSKQKNKKVVAKKEELIKNKQ